MFNRMRDLSLQFSEILDIFLQFHKKGVVGEKHDAIAHGFQRSGAPYGCLARRVVGSTHSLVGVVRSAMAHAVVARANVLELICFGWAF